MYILSHIFILRGGKGGATSIDNDHQFNVAIQTLLIKDKTKCQVAVEFDVDTMDGYRTCSRVSFLFNIFRDFKTYTPCLQPVLAVDALTDHDDKHVFGTRVSLVTMIYI